MRLFPNENTGKAWDHSVMQKNYQVLLGMYYQFIMQPKKNYLFFIIPFWLHFNNLFVNGL